MGGELVRERVKAWKGGGAGGTALRRGRREEGMKLETWRADWVWSCYGICTWAAFKRRGPGIAASCRRNGRQVWGRRSVSSGGGALRRGWGTEARGPSGAAQEPAL